MKAELVSIEVSGLGDVFNLNSNAPKAQDKALPSFARDPEDFVDESD